MTYESQTRQRATTTGCAFLSFSGTPTAGQPLTPAITGKSTGFGISISSNDITLSPGEYMLRFWGAITRSSNASNLTYQWREVGGSLQGAQGATNREIIPGTERNSFDSADAHVSVSSSTSFQIEMTAVDSSLTLDTNNTHAVIWGVE